VDGPVRATRKFLSLIQGQRLRQSAYPGRGIGMREMEAGLLKDQFGLDR